MEKFKLALVEDITTFARVFAVCDCCECEPEVALWDEAQGWTNPENLDESVGIQGHPDDGDHSEEFLTAMGNKHRGPYACPFCSTVKLLPSWTEAERFADEIGTLTQ